MKNIFNRKKYEQVICDSYKEEIWGGGGVLVPYYGEYWGFLLQFQKSGGYNSPISSLIGFAS